MTFQRLTTPNLSNKLIRTNRLLEMDITQTLLIQEVLKYLIKLTLC